MPAAGCRKGASSRASSFFVFIGFPAIPVILMVAQRYIFPEGMQVFVLRPFLVAAQAFAFFHGCAQPLAQAIFARVIFFRFPLRGIIKIILNYK
jgi:hypothetical protein